MCGRVKRAGEVDIGGDKEMGERQEGRCQQLRVFVSDMNPP